MKKAIIIIALSFTIVIAVFVWPSAYRYDRFHETVIKTNRFTGSCYALTKYGWIKLEEPKEHDNLPAPAPGPPAPEKPVY